MHISKKGRTEFNLHLCHTYSTAGHTLIAKAWTSVYTCVHSRQMCISAQWAIFCVYKVYTGVCTVGRLCTARLQDKEGEQLHFCRRRRRCQRRSAQCRVHNLLHSLSTTLTSSVPLACKVSTGLTWMPAWAWWHCQLTSTQCALLDPNGYLYSKNASQPDQMFIQIVTHDTHAKSYSKHILNLSSEYIFIQPSKSFPFGSSKFFVHTSYLSRAVPV